MLTSTWRSGLIRDVYHDFNQLTLAITLSALFGSEMSGMQAEEVTGACVC